jgi:hypothetical protein
MKESGIIISRQNIIWVIKGEYSTYEKKAWLSKKDTGNWD